MNRLLQNRRMLAYGAVISGILYVVSQAAIGMILDPLGAPAVLNLQLTFTAAGVNEILGSWGDAGIATFKKHFYLDFLHPLWYGSFLFFLMALTRPLHTGGREGAIPKYFALPVAAALFDLAENFCELALLGQSPDISEALAFFTASCSLIKWSLAGVSILIVAAFVIRIVIVRLKGPGR
ncbi:MAG: hypothetical protein JW807_14290 [Spirochaetes bacterium]|nr:hypothetical protein [Spirochaetota bacterium]